MNMVDYYDTIMTSGYYDYKKIVDNLLHYLPLQNVLEMGCGTGLLLEELLKREVVASVTGVDATEPMLDIARKRLEHFPNVNLVLQNVLDLTLEEQFDCAFSYGGVWYFVIEGDKEPVLISHIPDDAGNHQGFHQISEHITQGGTLLLGISNHAYLI